VQLLLGDERLALMAYALLSDLLAAQSLSASSSSCPSSSSSSCLTRQASFWISREAMHVAILAKGLVCYADGYA